MRPKFKIHTNRLSATILVVCVIATLIVSISLFIFSCSNETPLDTGQSLAPGGTAASGGNKPNFVVFVGGKSEMPRPFLASPGVCGAIGPAGGVVCNGPVTLIIPEGALGDNTDICISAFNPQQLIAEFTPAGQVFAADVSMRFSLAGTSAEGEAENVTTIWFNPATELWEDVVTEEPIDTNTTETLIRHFSKYAGHIDG